MINLLVILGVALLGRFFCQKFSLPIILGELLAGILIAGFALAQITAPIEFIANLGILFLLFSSGLSLDFDELRRLGKSSAVIAFTGAFFPFALGYVTAVLFGFGVPQAIFVGSVLIATSIGVNAKVLNEFGMLKTRLGTLIMGSAVLDDVIGIMVLGFLSGLAMGENALEHTLMLLGLTIAFFIFSMFVLGRILNKILKKYSFSPENLVLFGLIVAFAYALFAESIGLELVLGSFLGGLILGQTQHSRDLLENISIMGEAFFVPVFFVTVGMRFDLFALSGIGLFAAIIILVALTSKYLGSILGSIISGLNLKQAKTVGISMMPRAEMAIIITGVGLSVNVIDSGIASAALAVVLVSTIVTPPLLARRLQLLEKTDKNDF